MKSLRTVALLTFILFTLAARAQEPQKISLSQIPGKFEEKELVLKAGQSYVFEVANNGIDHEVGFVLAPKGKTDQPNHIVEAYLKGAVKDGEKQISNVVTLEKGDYVYFCPLNPTPQYTLKVE